jgi:hypothetical protein
MDKPSSNLLSVQPETIPMNLVQQLQISDQRNEQREEGKLLLILQKSETNSPFYIKTSFTIRLLAFLATTFRLNEISYLLISSSCVAFLINSSYLLLAFMKHTISLQIVSLVDVVNLLLQITSFVLLLIIGTCASNDLKCLGLYGMWRGFQFVEIIICSISLGLNLQLMRRQEWAQEMAMLIQ